MNDHSGWTSGARHGCRAGSALVIMACAAMVTGVTGASAAPLIFAETVMTGLANPRGMTFGPDGALYVAEAGSGGSGPTFTSGSGAVVGYGQSGAISRYQSGTHTRIAEDLPSVAPTGGAQAEGAQDVAFDAAGTLYATIGLGANPAVRGNELTGQAGAELLGTVVTIEAGTPQLFADIAAFEAANNPDGVVPDSNPFSLVATGSGFLVTDAGGNAVLSLDSTGTTITVEAVLPPTPNPLSPGLGGPTYQAVPTGAALDPSGVLYFGQLTGFPFVEDAANVFSLDGSPFSIFASGFTNLIDIGFGADGTLFALELDSDSLLGPNSTGALYAVGAGGSKELLYADLLNPTGFTIGGDGDFYVAINGFSPTDASVIRLAPVPLPAGFPALAGALALLAFLRRRSHRQD